MLNSKTIIFIKTFLRDPKLCKAIIGIRKNLPECKILVVDDGKQSEKKNEIYSDLIKEGHEVIICPFDIGFGAKSNIMINWLQSEKGKEIDKILISSDDFDFRPSSVREGIEKMLDVLENTDVDVASGRVRGPYEFDLEDKGDVIIEHPVNIPLNPEPWFVYCDLTVNYNLIKRRVFEKVRWDEPEPRIGGGEHGAFYLDCKRANFKVAYVPGVFISEQQGEDSEEYKSYRARAASPARPCFVKRGIRRYILGNGKVDWEAPDYYEPITR